MSVTCALVTFLLCRSILLVNAQPTTSVDDMCHATVTSSTQSSMPLCTMQRFLMLFRDDVSGVLRDVQRGVADNGETVRQVTRELSALKASMDSRLTALEVTLNSLETCKSDSDKANVGTTVLAAVLEREFWTSSTTGCECYFDTTRQDCACCQNGGGQCGRKDPHLCVAYGHGRLCSETAGLERDFWTRYTTGCECSFDTTRQDCACCQNSGEQCGKDHPHLCVASRHARILCSEIRRCPQGYRFNPGTSHCYNVHTDTMGWSEAVGVCGRRDAHLISVRSSVEREAAKGIIERTAGARIGLNEVPQEFKFHYDKSIYIYIPEILPREQAIDRCRDSYGGFLARFRDNATLQAVSEGLLSRLHPNCSTTHCELMVGGRSDAGHHARVASAEDVNNNGEQCVVVSDYPGAPDPQSFMHYSKRCNDAPRKSLCQIPLDYWTSGVRDGAGLTSWVTTGNQTAAMVDALDEVDDAHRCLAVAEVDDQPELTDHECDRDKYFICEIDEY